MDFTSTLNQFLLIPCHASNILWTYLQLTSGMLFFMYVWDGFSSLIILMAYLLLFLSWISFYSLSILGWPCSIVKGFHSCPHSNISSFESQEWNQHDGSQAYILDGDLIPNDVRYNLDITPGRPPSYWWYIPACQQIFGARRRVDDKMTPWSL